MLALAVGGGLLMRANTGSQASEAGDQAPKAVGTSRASETAKDGDTAIAPEFLQTAAAVSGANPRSSEERRQLLETVGTLTAAHCHQTYLNIGFIADGKAKGTYSDDAAYRLLDLIVSLLDSVDRRLTVLAKIDLGTEDRASLQQMRDLSDLLYRQANQLETFWHSGKDEDGARYEEVRKASWAAIRKFTGIDRESGAVEK